VITTALAAGGSALAAPSPAGALALVDAALAGVLAAALAAEAA
jgi:hypothetical protein